MPHAFEVIILFSMISCFIAQAGWAQTTPPLTLGASDIRAVRRMNPDIGLNLLILYQNSNRGNSAFVADRNGLSLQEAELQFSSDVDPYWRLAAIFGLHQEVDVDETSTPPVRTAEYVFEPEEAFAETLSLPLVTLKAGKFKAAFGRHNQLHLHAFPFLDAPLVNSWLLGEEGLSDVGVAASVLLPTRWFSEATLQVLSGKGEGIDYFDSESANDFAYLARFENLWDLSDDLTFEFGLSGISGENASSSTTNLYNLDFTFKWRPDGRRDRALIWSTEAIGRDFERDLNNEQARGVTSWLQFQATARCWLQVRGEYLEITGQDPGAPEPLPAFQRKQSLLVGFIATEFSAVRLQYDHLSDGEDNDEHKVMAQLNYSIGAHPAHAY